MKNNGFMFEFEKADSLGRYVRGWASVISEDGKAVTDHQGDIIPPDELRKAAHRFVCDARVAKAMHSGKPVGEVVESVVIVDAFATAVGMDASKRGWWIGMKINDPSVKERVRKGELKAFSIGGRGRRTKMETR